MVGSLRFNLALTSLLALIRGSHNYLWQELLASEYRNTKLGDIPELAYPLRTESDPACGHLSCPAGEIARYPVLIPIFRRQLCFPNPLECMCMPPDHYCTAEELEEIGWKCHGKGVCITRGNPICPTGYDRLSDISDISNKSHVCYTPESDACQKLHDYDFLDAGNFFYRELNEPCDWSIYLNSYNGKSTVANKRFPKRKRLERVPYLAEQHGRTAVIVNSTCKSGNHCESRPGQTCSIGSQSYGDGLWMEYTQRCKFTSNPCESTNNSCPNNTTCIVVTGYVPMKEADDFCGKYDYSKPMKCEYLNPSYEEIKCATDLDLKTKYSKSTGYLGTWSYARDRK